MGKPVQEERFEYKGFPCVVLFQSMGFRCGYVGLPKDNQYYRKEYDDIPVNCHCGLTYSSSTLFHQEDKNTWWIGFDCGHACDGFDIDKLKEYYAEDDEVMKMINYMHSYHTMMNENYDYRTLDYVKEECKKIVDQLIVGGA